VEPLRQGRTLLQLHKAVPSPPPGARWESRSPDHPRRLQLGRSLSWIVEAALKNRHQQFVIDGEAVVLGVDGITDFNALRSRQHDEESAALCAFDILTLDGEDDLRALPLSMRKTTRFLLGYSGGQ
jgi:ATP-dependent DNA ligase